MNVHVDVLCFEEKSIRRKCGIFCTDTVILHSAQSIHLISISYFKNKIFPMC